MWQPDCSMRLSSAARSTVLLPIRDGLGDFRPDAVDLLEFGAAGAEDGSGIAEALQQLPDAHRTESLNHVQSDKRFPAIHARQKTPFSPPGQALDWALDLAGKVRGERKLFFW